MLYPGLDLNQNHIVNLICLRYWHVSGSPVMMHKLWLHFLLYLHEVKQLSKNQLLWRFAVFESVLFHEYVAKLVIRILPPATTFGSTHFCH